MDKSDKNNKISPELINKFMRIVIEVEQVPQEDERGQLTRRRDRIEKELNKIVDSIQ